MASSKVLLLLGLAFVVAVVISSEAVSARDLAETTETGETVGSDHYGGHGGYGHGGGKGYGHGGGYGKGHGGYGHGGHGGYGHGGHGGYGHGGHGGKPGHGGHPGHGAAEETEAGNK